jgi:aspartyl-tRNA(Asn)/glutamyl-tRNA(Gln) amidotransferase subunit B
VCDGKMEEGSLRCEPNISIRLENDEKLGTKTELKNLNSFRAVQMGISYEVDRQAKILNRGEKVLQETRGWNEESESSFAMRIKEAENDYRYFPCPDLTPMEFSDNFIEELKSSLPELPLAKFMRYQKDFGLSEYDTKLLIANKDWALWFEEAVSKGGDPKIICNWMNSDFSKLLKEEGKLVTESRKIAKEIFAKSYSTGKMPSEIVQDLGATQLIDVNSISDLAKEVLSSHKDVVTKYLNGQVSVKGFLVGQIMKASKGRANPSIVNSTLDAILNEFKNSN